MAFVPSDLSSIIAWWRSEDIPSGTPDPLNWDDVVSGWRLSASGSAIPAYSATAIGGLPGLDFDGTNDTLKTSTTKTLSGQIGVAVVYRKDSGEADAGVMTLSSSTSPALGADNFQNIRCLTSNVYMYGPSTTTREDAVGRATLTDLLGVSIRGTQIGGLRFAGLRMRPNGGAGTISNFSSNAAYFHIGNIGAGVFLDGKISEVVIWQEPYSGTEPHYLWVEGYLGNKYSISLGTNHKFYAAAPTSAPTSGGVRSFAGMNGGFSG